MHKRKKVNLSKHNRKGMTCISHNQYVINAIMVSIKVATIEQRNLNQSNPGIPVHQARSSELLTFFFLIGRKITKCYVFLRIKTYYEADVL